MGKAKTVDRLQRRDYRGRQQLQLAASAVTLRIIELPQAEHPMPINRNPGPRPHTKHAAIYAAWAAEHEAARQDLLLQIQTAFANVVRGDGTSLHQARAIDDYEDPPSSYDARFLDPEQTWQEITTEKASKFGDALYFMDAEGYRFYIPRFMTFTLRKEDKSAFADGIAVSSFSPTRRGEDRLRLLSDEQWAAMQAFAAFMADEP